MSQALTEDRSRLLEQLLKKRGISVTAQQRIPRRQGEGPWQTSFSQERLWFIDQLEPGSAAYNIPLAARLSGRLEPEALRRALGAVVERHESLRTVFRTVGGEPRQEVLAPSRFPLPRLDLCALSAGRRGTELERLVRREAVRPFDLASGPLLRVRLVVLAPEEHAVLLTLHHIIGDGWSVEVLLREAAVLYAGLSGGNPSSLPELPIQYADFAEWQRQHHSGDVLEAELDHWRETLRGLSPVLDLPTDRPRPPVQSFRGASRGVALPGELRDRLAQLGRERGATLFMVLLAAYQAVLHRHSGQAAFAVGSPVAGRRRSETENLIGFFANTLVLRADLAGDPAFATLLERVRTAVVDGQSHQDLPLEKVVQELRPERSLSHNALFQVMFSLESVEVAGHGGEEPGSAFGALSLEPLSSSSATAKVDLTLVFRDAGDRLGGWVEFATDLFDPTTVERFVRHLRTLLRAAVAAPERPISRLPLLEPGEAQQLLREWPGAPSPYPSQEPVGTLFAAWVERAPDAVALEDGDLHLTYGELARRAGRLADRLLDRGVGPEVPVALYLERGAGFLVALLAVVEAGGTYVPLDRAYPIERLASMLEDCAAPVLLTSGDLAPSLTELRGRGAEVLLVEEGVERTAGSPPRPPVAPDNLFYVIYTSGSTGRPKGVAVSHRGVVRLVRQTDYVDLEPGVRVAQVSNTSFDAATFEIWGALLNGGRLITVPREVALDPPRLVAFLAARGIDVLFLTTALFNQVAATEAKAFDPLHTVLFGGEAVDPGRVRQVLKEGGPRRLLHVYGPTESTTYSSWHRVRRVPPEAVTVPIGTSIANTTIQLYDRTLEPVPAGVTGELWIGGDGLARGYLGRPARTAAVFRPHPHGTRPGQRLYRTGDLVRRRADGAIEFLGRADHQVKVRGFRIELGEVESVLAAVDGVRDAVVVGSRDETGAGLRLVAYVVPREGTEPTAAALRDRLRIHLPDYMVPSAFVFLDRLPLNPNGKVERAALPAPEAERDGGGVPYQPPLGAREDLMASLWSEVLGLERVGRRDDFFELGGHSLLATRLISRVREAFAVETALRDLFEAPTLSALTRRVDLALAQDAGRMAPPVEPVPRDGDLPLSFSQQRLWFIDRLDPGSPLYNLPVALRIEGPLQVGALAAALGAAELRHEVLRTVYRERDGEPRQRVLPPRSFPLPQVDLCVLPEGVRRRELRRLVRAEARRPFDLARGPVWRCLLLRLEEAEHAAVVTSHHVASDGWSLRILIREVSELYDAALTVRRPDLSPLPVQYADYAVWQRGWLRGDVLEAEVGHWEGRLAGLPPLLELPTDRPRPPLQDDSGAVLQLRLPDDLAVDLRAFGRQRGATLFMVLLAGFQALLSRYADELDVAVGTPVAGRGRLELEGLVGFFVNTLVQRTDLTGAPGFGTLLDRVREGVLDADDHQHLPFERLVEALAPERSLAHTPLFQVMFDLAHAADAVSEPAGLRLSPLPNDPGIAKFDLTLAMEEAGQRLVGSLEYATALFDRTTVRRMVEHWTRLLAAAVADPQTPVAELPWMSAEERQQVVEEWPRGDEPALGSDLAALIEVQVSAAPDRVAVVAEEGVLTLGELDRRARRVAAALAAAGVGPGSTVGVLCRRGADLVSALVAVVRSGAAYLPLDPEIPPQRLAALLGDTAAEALLLDGGSAEALPAFRGVRLDVREARPVPRGVEPRPAVLDPSSPAYVIYTSGSTGEPKGVVVSHRSAATYARTAAHHYRLGVGDRVVQLASVSFDLSFEEIFVPLCCGATVVVVPDAARLSPAWLLRLGEREEVTFLTLSTAYWHEMTRELERGALMPRALRRVVIGGEAPLPEAVARWRRHAPAAVRLVNTYGPTEATVVSTLHPVAAGDGFRLPIGRPVAGATNRVLDRRGRSVPPGVAGELCLGGTGVAQGYLGDPRRTAERFVPDPEGVEPGERLYRTGDRVRWRPDGSLDYLGRLDRQVKVRGFRVEPGEVEAHLARLPQVAAAAVIAPRGRGGERRLTACVVVREPDSAGATLARGLRHALRSSLPDYMVPGDVVFVDALPLTPSGKVDRRALARLSTTDREHRGDVAYLPPRNPVEEVVANVWAEVLEVERVGREDHFFDLGGHSLLATRVIARLRAALGVELPLRELFEEPTVRGLAERVERALAQRSEPLPPLVPVPRDRDLPLSFAQQRLWFIDRLEPGSALYNMPLALRVEGRLDAGVLCRCLAEVERRHEVLRTHFVESNGVPLQVVEPPRDFPLPRVDLSRLPAHRREEALAAWVETDALAPFDLTAGFPWRARLVRLDEDRHAVLVSLHHVAGDGWSLGILVDEVTRLYAAFSGETPAELAPLPVQYADFAAWQRGWLQGEILTEELEHWRRRLDGVDPVIELPTDRPRRIPWRHRGALVNRRPARALQEAVEVFARRRGATLFMVLLAGLQALLGRLSGKDRFNVGTPVAGRTRLETEGLIGFFVNTVVIPSDLAAAKGFADLVDQAREESLHAHAHQDLPFERLVEELDPSHDLASTPLFQVLFVVQNVARETLEVEGLSIAPLDPQGVQAKFDLMVAVEEEPEGVRFVWQYDRDLFDRSTVLRMAAALERTLEAGIADPQAPHRQLPLLSPAERHQLTREWNDTARLPLGAWVGDRVLHQARRRPDALAVAGGDEHLTYGALVARARALAGELTSHGVGRESVVGVQTRRSPAMVVSQLAVLLAGGAYMPLDPSHPAQRRAAVLFDAAATVLVSEPDLANELSQAWERGAGTGTMPPVVDPGAPRPAGGAGGAGIAVRPSPANLAYVLFTSGSTGRPKGVAMAHRSLAHYLDWTASIGFGVGGRVAQVAGHAFDASVLETWSALAGGGSLHLLPSLETLAPMEMASWMRSRQLTHAFLPTPVAEALLSSGRGRDLFSMKTIITGGDRLRRAPEEVLPFTLVNIYGPTETCVNSTAYAVPADGAPSPSIGSAIRNTRLQVLDRFRRPVPVGVAGELWIGGAGVARGYLGQPALTAARFVPDPLAGAGARPVRRPVRGPTAPATWCGGCRTVGWTSSAVSITRSRCVGCGWSSARSSRSCRPSRRWRTWSCCRTARWGRSTG